MRNARKPRRHSGARIGGHRQQGLLLCRDKNNIEVEFSLRDMNKPMGVSAANENFARELMQLFTIGLYQLNPDGSLTGVYLIER